eukprot:94642_1
MNPSPSWSDLDIDTIKFDTNAVYRIILRELNDVDEEEYSAIYMNSCTPYELYFNEAIDNHVYGCVNVNNLTQYEHRMKGQRDIKIKNSQTHSVYKVQISTSTSKWHTFNDKYFNIHNDYKLIINEDDSSINAKLSPILIHGYIRKTTNIENKGFNHILSIITRYYNSTGKLGYINMEQVVKRELYFTPSTNNHWYGCIKSDNLSAW